MQDRAAAKEHGCATLKSVSLIIPTLNSSTLGRALEAIRLQTSPPDEVIVVGLDERQVTAGFPEVRFIDTGHPVCAAAARNRGVEAARGDFMVFTDADCVPRPDWLACLRSRHESGESVVGGSVIIEVPNYWALSDNLAMFHAFRPEYQPGARPFLPTLNLSLHRSVWEKVGGLDESFDGAGSEDSDWTIRMRRAGFRLFFDPLAQVLHSPTRRNFRAVARHWRHSGRNSIRVRLRYAQEFGTPQLARNPFLIRLASPLIAALVTGRIFMGPGAARYRATLPVVYLTKIIYCLGAAEALQSGEAFL